MLNKTMLALILALVLLIAGAFLPRIVGNVMDHSVSDKIEFSQISNVQLEFVQSEMPMEEILGILCKYTHSAEVPTDLTSHSENDIQRLAQQTISHYQDAGLIHHSVDFSTDLQFCAPQLHYEQGSNRKSNFFWNLNLYPADKSWSLEMILDDRTGKLCSIAYHHYGTTLETQNTNDPEPSLYEDLNDSLLTFANLFLIDLGESFAQMDTQTLSDGISTSIDEDYVSTTVSWKDIQKGECRIIFYLLDNSFYTVHY